MCLFFVCTVTDFSATEKDKGVKFCIVRLGLLSAMIFSNFGGQRSKVEDTRDKNALSAANAMRASTHCGRESVGHSELGAGASRQAVWCDLRLASLLRHVLIFILPRKIGTL